MTVTAKESTVAEAAESQVSEAQIAVHWREEDYIQPPPQFVAQANAGDPIESPPSGTDTCPTSMAW